MIETTVVKEVRASWRNHFDQQPNFEKLRTLHFSEIQQCQKAFDAMRREADVYLHNAGTSRQDTILSNYHLAILGALADVEPLVSNYQKTNNLGPSKLWAAFYSRFSELLEASVLDSVAYQMHMKTQASLQGFRAKPQPTNGVNEDDVVRLAFHYKDARQARQLFCFSEWLTTPRSLRKSSGLSMAMSKTGELAQREARDVFVVGNEARPDCEIILRVSAWSMTYISLSRAASYRKALEAARADGVRHFAQIVAQNVLIAEETTPAKMENLLCLISEGDVVTFLRRLCTRALYEGLKCYLPSTNRKVLSFDDFDAPYDTADPAISPEDYLLLKESIDGVLASLPFSSSEKEAVKLRADGLSDKEIGQVLGLDVRTVEKRFERMRKKI